MKIVIADDLTGATDTGIQFQKNGFRTTVIVEGSRQNLKKKENDSVLAINMNSRALKPQDAYERTVQTVKKLSIDSEDLVFKKLDSLMRGNPVEELDAVLDETGRKVAILAPSFPATGRLVENGILHMPGGIRKNLVALFEERSHYPIQLIDIASLRQENNRLLEQIGSMQRDEKKIFLFDSMTEADLRIAAVIAETLNGAAILCGSAGFAREIAGKALKKPVKTAFSKGKVLVVTGSRKKETADQIREINNRYGMPIVVLRSKDILCGIDNSIEKAITDIERELKENPVGVILTLDSLFDNQSGFEDDDHREKEAGNILADAVQKVLEAISIHSFQALIVAGGDTSLRVCRAFRVTQIQLVDEIKSGMPIGVFADGKTKGVPVITKSGAFGDKNMLNAAMEFLLHR